jgi:hypothetical protein
LLRHCETRMTHQGIYIKKVEARRNTSETSEEKMASTTFAVNQVEICTKTHSHGNTIEPSDLARWSAKNEQLSLENCQTNHSLAIELNGRNYRIKNAFVATIFEAYCKHYPLEISIDDFWVAIAQGISIHLNQNAEKYRTAMVSHEGKKTLLLAVDDLRISDSQRPANGNKSVPAIDWPTAVERMCQMIGKDMRADLKTLITSSFSTTTLVEQTVLNCTLMDSVKSYYDYLVSLSCGIPQVTLRGSPDDFQHAINRLQQLRTLLPDFQWWLDKLIPHFEQLKLTAQGKANIDWWSKICHQTGGGSDITVLVGWLADFIP